MLNLSLYFNMRSYYLSPWLPVRTLLRVSTNDISIPFCILFFFAPCIQRWRYVWFWAASSLKKCWTASITMYPSNLSKPRRRFACSKSLFQVIILLQQHVDTNKSLLNVIWVQNMVWSRCGMVLWMPQIP